jgi:hypothetical protein
MKHIIIIFTSFLFILIFISQANSKSNGLQKGSHLNKRDTVFIPVPVDTMRFSVISREYLPEVGFLEKNEGTLIGSFLAAIVAVISILATNYFHNKRDVKKEGNARIEKENLYAAVLISIHSILLSHDERTKRMKEELAVVLEESLGRSHIIIEKSSITLSLDLLNQFLIKLLNYHKFNQILLNTVIAYIHRANNLNQNLDFTPAIKLQKTYIAGQVYDEAVKSYFNAIDKNINTLVDLRGKLKILISDEVKMFPQFKIVSESQVININQS